MVDNTKGPKRVKKVSTIKTKMSMITKSGKKLFGASGELSAAIGKQFDEYAKKVKTKLDKIYQDTFGNTNSFDDWKRPSVAQSKIQRSSINEAAFGNRTVRAKMLTLYVNAWKRKYDKVRQEYKARDPGYKDREWYKRKVSGKGKYRPQHNRTKTVKYVEWGLATGHFRDTIVKQLRAGTGDAIDMQNILVTSGFSINYAAQSLVGGGVRQDHYYQYVQHLVDLGVLTDTLDMPTFLPRDQDQIAETLEELIQRGFIDQALRVLRNEAFIVE